MDLRLTFTPNKVCNTTVSACNGTAPHRAAVAQRETAMKKQTIKTPAASESFIAEIVGSESLIGRRMSAGKLLHMMDIAAAEAAHRHAGGPVITLAFDRIEMLDHIRHRDYVRFDATVIQVGRSSMVVAVNGSVKPPTAMDITPAHGSFITMVAIDARGRPDKNIPRLRYESAQDRRWEETARQRARVLKARKQRFDAMERRDEIAPSCFTDFGRKGRLLPPSDTVMTLRKAFLPRNVNHLGNVFGGDTVEMMEELALAAARQFTGNVNMVTIAMEDVFFLNPLHIEDIAEMEASIIFVARTTLVAEVTVRSIPRLHSDAPVVTNRGTFTVLNYGPGGRKLQINNGLDLTSADLATRKACLKEQLKYMDRKGAGPPGVRHPSNNR